MQLSEKIYYCRKKAGQSQEALAEQLGVSRQSVSKWETGEAEPEIGKLKLLAKAFDVSVDWLLSDEEPAEDVAMPAQNPPPANQSAHWVDAIPGVIGKLLRQYGWLFGVFTAVAGVFFALIGILARYLSNQMQSSFDKAQNDMFNQFNGPWTMDNFGNQWYNTTTTAAFNPVSIMGTVILVIGIILIVAGVVLAIVLTNAKKK